MESAWRINTSLNGTRFGVAVSSSAIAEWVRLDDTLLNPWRLIRPLAISQVIGQPPSRSQGSQLLIGSDYKVLSSVSLFPLEMQETTPLPWSEGLAQQHGQHITCIPYNIDPASAFKALSDAKFDAYPDLEASLSTVEPTLVRDHPASFERFANHLTCSYRPFTVLC